MTNNIQSIDRSVDKHLYLVLKSGAGNQSFPGSESASSQWLFPLELYKPELDGNSLRSTLERCVTTLFPVNHDNDYIMTPNMFIHFKYLGNCPVGHYSYHYPKPIKERLKNGAIGMYAFNYHY